MKRKVTLSSRGDLSGVKITVEMNSKPGVGRDELGRAMDCLTDACAKAICDAPYTGAAYAHQIKIR
jgi:hypothetical protein